MSLLNINELFDNFYKYLEARIDLFKFEAKESITEAVISLVQIVTLLILSLFIFTFLSIGLALFLNDVLQSHFLGFFIVAGIYCILLIVAIVLKNSTSFKAKIMASMFKEEARKAQEEPVTEETDI
ncbi:MAG: phage holin family protein [Bacteroidota bacterium]